MSHLGHRRYRTLEFIKTFEFFLSKIISIKDSENGVCIK